MFTKILLTSAVILLALTAIRHRSGASRTSELQNVPEARSQAMFIALGLVGLTLTISAWLFYQHWEERHRLFSVQVINSHTGQVQRYQVYQDDIEGRSFRTIDGVLIHLSESERMEVQAVQESGSQ